MARPSLMFRLGQFVGGVARGVTQPIRGDRGERQVLKHEVQEHTERQGDTTVTLRRTTIEEVEVRPGGSGGAPSASNQGGPR